MTTKKPYYRRHQSHNKYGKSRDTGVLKRIVTMVLIIAVIVAAGIVFIPRLVHHCDHCDRLFLGTGYHANVVTDAFASLQGKEEKILCRDCAEKNHAVEILTGKALEDFRRPLFEKKGD